MAQNWLGATVLVPCFALGLAAQDPAPAPNQPAAGEVIKIEEHRSRWDYPREVQVPEGHRLHIVAPGDTLWALGAKYLGNPYSWPQIWEKNKWIKDSHWIYPGDPILVDASRTPVAQSEPAAGADAPKNGDLAPQEVADLPPDGGRPARKESAPIARPRREELGFGMQDFLRMPYLAEKGFEAHMKDLGGLPIVGKQDPLRTRLTEGDVVYLAGGVDKGLKVGDRRLVVHLEKTRLFHPDDQRQKNPLGDVVRHTATVRVTSVNPKGSVAVVERALDSVQTGDHTVPFQEPANMAMRLRSETESPVAIKDVAKTIFIQEDHGRTSAGEMIIVDKGEKDGLKVGDVLLGLRPRTFEVTAEKRAKDRTVERTNYYLGQVLVVKVTDTSATCRIIKSLEEFVLGDILTR